MSIKNDGHYFCRAGGNRPDGLNEPVTVFLLPVIIILPTSPKSISR
ncbi:TPA: copper resistance protein [Escherichia coli]|nr:copper resistance protein [Escherichia coli]